VGGGSQARDGNGRQAVVQLVETLAVGGAEQLAVRIANGRARQGHPSFVYVLGDGGPLEQRIDPAVGVRRLGIRRASIADPLRFLSSLRRGRRILRGQLARDGAGVVQSHLPNANFWNLLLQVSGDARAVPTIHNNREFSYGSGGVKGRLNRVAYRMMLRRCLAVVACSEPVRLSLAEALGVDPARAARLVAIPNGVEIPDPPGPGFREEVRRRHGVAPDALLVVGAGRLSRQKNFAALVAAAAALAPEFPGLRVVIGGEGELRSDLEDQVRAGGVDGVVSLPGNVLDLPDLLLAADVLAIPSRYEGLPLVLLEGMAAGLPVAGSRIPGIAEVVQDGESGRLAAPGDDAGFAAALGELLRDEAGRRRCGAAARAKVAADYGFARVLEQLDGIFRRARA